MANSSLPTRKLSGLLQAYIPVLLLISLCISSVKASTVTREGQDLIECTYYEGSLRYNITDRNRMVHLCRILAASTVEGMSGNYELPPIFEFDDLESGSTKLTLHDLEPNPNTGVFDIIGPNPSFSIVPAAAQYYEASEKLFAAAVATTRTVGSRNVMVVRVTSTDAGSPSYDRQELSRNIFGDPNNVYRPSFATQYEQCSQGQLRFRPASYGGDSETGVHDLNLPHNLLNRNFDFQFDQLLETAFVKKFGSTDSYDHILYCLPQGMAGEFVAFAVLNGNISYYSDPWCAMMSATMHEIGHNLGMRHSGEYQQAEYDDESCVMGIGYASETGPLKCFNGQKFWAFNWFPDQTNEVNPKFGEWKGNLAAFVDVTYTTADVAIRVGDMYLVFNEASRHNSGVNEKKNKVTIVQATTSKTNSIMLTGLGANDQLTTDATFSDGIVSSIEFEVCAIKQTNAVSYAELSIRLQGTPSSCGIAAAAPGPAPNSSGACSAGGSSCQNDDQCCGNCALSAAGYRCVGDGTADGMAMPQYGGSRGGAGGNNMRRRALRSPEEGTRLGATASQSNSGVALSRRRV